ncbi:cysteine-rich protein with zinc finger [Cryptosporidium felis]|nr:cysteine-rich protein with zinc finger [Cryptosporidium felis]
MDDLFLAEFHGFIDERTWEVAKLSINYLQTLKCYILRVLDNGGVLERYSQLRDLIEIIRICTLHGILVGVNALNSKEQKDKFDCGSLFYFVKLFPELKGLEEVDDMCFLSFLLMNKVFSGFLESMQNPISAWNKRISVFYHHASILRYHDFIREFISIINSLEGDLKIKNFHIPNNWMTYFARLSLRWSNFGNDQPELCEILTTGPTQKLGGRSRIAISRDSRQSSGRSHSYSIEHGSETRSSTLNFLLKSEIEQTHILESSIYDDKRYFSRQSNVDSNGTYLTEYHSNSETGTNFVYNEDDIQDIQDLLENLWFPGLECSPDSRSHKEERNRILQSDGEDQVEIGNYREDFKTLKNLQSECSGNTFLESEKDLNFRVVSDYYEDEEPDVEPNIDFNVKIGNTYSKRYVPEVNDWYLCSYSIPTSRQEKTMVLELQEYKCFQNSCESELELGDDRMGSFCCLTGYYYCDKCFGSSDSCSVLPGLLARYGNLTPVPVSKQSKELLENLRDRPLIKINSLTAEIWESNKYMRQFVYLKRYLSSLWDETNKKEGKEENKCQFKESIKRRLSREYEIVNQNGKSEYFSVNQLIQIAYELFSQDITMHSTETGLQSVVRELTEVAVNWRKHLTKCIHCQFQGRRMKL